MVALKVLFSDQNTDSHNEKGHYLHIWPLWKVWRMWSHVCLSDVGLNIKESIMLWKYAKVWKNDVSRVYEFKCMRLLFHLLNAWYLLWVIYPNSFMYLFYEFWEWIHCYSFAVDWMFSKKSHCIITYLWHRIVSGLHVADVSVRNVPKKCVK